MADNDSPSVSVSNAASRGWAPWIAFLVLAAGIGVVGWRAETTARAVNLLQADVDGLELNLDALKKARALQSPLRLPAPTPSRTAKARPPGAGAGAGAAREGKAKAPAAGAQQRTGKAKAGKTKATP